MLSHVGNVVAVLAMWAFLAALCLFGLWACSVVLRRLHLPGLLVALGGALALSFVPLVTLGLGGNLETVDLPEGAEWMAIIINGLGLVLWWVIPRPIRDESAEAESHE